jgi:hypothetical protein
MNVDGCGHVDMWTVHIAPQSRSIRESSLYYLFPLVKSMLRLKHVKR